jgi:hypothetical protein
MYKWTVQAMVMSPGEFPAQYLRRTVVKAVNIADAINIAVAAFVQIGIEPIDVTYVRRGQAVTTTKKAP